MNVSSVTTYGSAAIATAPTSAAAAVKPDDKPAPPQIEPAAAPAGTGQIVDKSV